MEVLTKEEYPEARDYLTPGTDESAFLAPNGRLLVLPGSHRHYAMARQLAPDAKPDPSVVREQVMEQGIVRVSTTASQAMAGYPAESHIFVNAAVPLTRSQRVTITQDVESFTAFHSSYTPVGFDPTSDVERDGVDIEAPRRAAVGRVLMEMGAVEKHGTKTRPGYGRLHPADGGEYDQAEHDELAQALDDLTSVGPRRGDAEWAVDHIQGVPDVKDSPRFSGVMDRDGYMHYIDEWAEHQSLARAVSQELGVKVSVDTFIDAGMLRFSGSKGRELVIEGAVAPSREQLRSIFDSVEGWPKVTVEMVSNEFVPLPDFPSADDVTGALRGRPRPQRVAASADSLKKLSDIRDELEALYLRLSPQSYLVKAERIRNPVPKTNALSEEVADHFTDAVKQLRKGVSIQTIIAAIGAEDWQAIDDVLGWERFLTELNKAAGLIKAQFTLSGELESGKLRRLRVPVRFDITNPRASSYARARAAEMVVAIQESTREAIRKMVVRSLEQGITVDGLAATIKDVIGLHPRWAQAVLNYRARLTARGLDPEVVAAESTAYADKLLKLRAQTIARNEIVEAGAQGRVETWKQAAEQGYIAEGSKRRWVAAVSDRTCPTCMEMNGQEAEWDQPYILPTGFGVDVAHAHVQCRCSEVLVPP